MGPAIVLAAAGLHHGQHRVHPAVGLAISQQHQVIDDRRQTPFGPQFVGVQRRCLEREQAGHPERLEPGGELAEHPSRLVEAELFAHHVGDGVDHHAHRLAGGQLVRQDGEELADADVLARHAEHVDAAPVDRTAERETERCRSRDQLLRVILEQDVQSGLAALGSGKQELDGGRGLADAGAPRHQRDAPREQPTADQRIEPRDSRWQPARDLGRRRCVTHRIDPVAREYRDPTDTDDHVVTALEVRRVAQLVDLDVALALQALLDRAQHDDTVDDGLLDTESADLRGAVGHIGREQRDGLRVLDDAAQVIHFLAVLLRIGDLVEEHRERIDHDALRTERGDPFTHHDQVCLHHDLGLGDEHDLDHAAFDLSIELPAEAARRGGESILGLLEREQDALLACLRAAIQELERQHRLPRARDAR
ncbi:MAG TPA: hypothetical protein VF469_03455 [Kofleriaceae bacterium]